MDKNSKLDQLDPKVLANLIRKRGEIHQRQMALTPGSSGHKWNAILTRTVNLEEKLVQLGFAKGINRATGFSEVDMAMHDLMNRYFKAIEDATLTADNA